MSQMVAEMRTIAHDAATAASRAVVQELRQPSLSPKPDPGDTAHHAATSAPAPALVPASMPPPLSPGSLGDDLGALPVAPPRQLGAHDLGRSLKTALSQFSPTDSWPIYRDDFLAHLTTVNPVLVAVLLGARPPAHGLTAESFSLLQQQLSATLTVVMKSHPTAATRLRNLRRSDTFAAANNPGTLAWDQLCTHLDRRGVARTVRHLLALQQPQSPSEDQGAFTQRMLNAYHELNDSPVPLHSNVLHENVLVAATLAGMHNTVARDTILSALDAAETRAEDISYGRLCDMMHRHPTTPDSKPIRPGQDVAAFAAAMHTQLHSQVEAAVVAAMARAPPPARPPYARPPRGGPQNNARQHPPTTPCRICESQGKGKRFHWHAHCPLNQAPAAPTAAPPPAPATHQAVVSPVSAASAFSDELSHMMAFLGNPDSAAPNAMMAHAGPSGIHSGFLSVFCGKAAAPLPVAASGMILVDGGANICMEPDVSRFRAYSPLTTPVPCSGLGVDILGFGSIDISVVYTDGVSRPLTVRAAHAPGMTARGAPTILSQEYLRREHGVSFSYPARGAPSATDSHGSLVLTMVNDLPFLTGGHSEFPGTAPPSACLAYKGPPESPPGMDLTRCWASGTIRLSQEQYTLELLEKYGMQDCSPAKTPMGSGHYKDLASASDAEKAPLSREDHETYRAILGSVNFLTMCTRPDLAFAISVLSRFQSAPQKIHLMQLKRVLRYLKGTPGMGITYGATEPGGARLVVYSDSDWAADTSNRRSQSGDISMLNGGPDALTLQGRGGDEITMNMRAFLASEDHRRVYNELRGNRPEVIAELRKVRNLCTGRLAQSKSLVPLGVADDRYRTDVCQGNEDAATYSRHGLAFLLPAQDVHASAPKGGLNHAFATGCPTCKDLAVDHEDKARRRKHETARTMAAAKEMRQWNPEAHIGDDEYILADRGANARRPGQRGANARRPGQRGANARRPGQRGANARWPGQRDAIARRPGQGGANARRPGQRGANARQPGQRGANARRPGQRGANARRPGHVGDLCNPAY
eukprot:jgi/Tetstr1/456813/TSEL_043487.t1